MRWRARQGLDLRPLTDRECLGLHLAVLACGAEGAVPLAPARAVPAEIIDNASKAM